MGALSNLREFFAPKHVLVAHINDPFVQIDLKETARKLELEERGQEQGALNLPTAESKTFDNVEQEIIHEVGEALTRAQIEGANQIRTFDDRLASLTLLGQLSTIRPSASRAGGDFNAEVLKTRDRLTTARDAIAESYQELRDFKAAHRLSRPAHDAPHRIVTGGAIFISWFFETLLNTSLLRMNDAMGILGGFLAAAAIGALNVGISAVVGRNVLPYLSHMRVAHRAWALLLTLVWLGTLLVWNLIAAHYRDAKASGADDPEGTALYLFSTETFALDSLYSWGLLAAGLLFALIAAAAGYKMDDPYPGYGAVHRRHTARCEYYSDSVAEAIDELAAIRDDAITEAQDIRNELARQHSERDQILVHREAFRRRYEEHCAQLENTANGLLEVYRNANRRARTDDPPSHFNERWKLSIRPLPPSPPLPLIESELAGANIALEEMISRVVQDFETAIGSFETLETLKARLRSDAA